MADARLGELLLKAGVVSAQQLSEAETQCDRTGVRLGQILVDRGWVRESSLYDALAKAAGLPRLDMKTVKVDRAAIRHVDSIWALDHGMVPLFVDMSARTIQIAVTDPTNIEPLDELSFRTGLRVQSWLGSEAEIGRLIRHQFFEEPLDGREISLPSMPAESAIEHGMVSALSHLQESSAPPTPSESPQDLAARLAPIFEGHQENARNLQAIFELCVRRGIITREEYLRRLAAAPDA